MVKSDQKIRTDARQFPEDKQADEVAGQNQAEHGGHKKKKEGIESTEMGMAGQIPPGVNHNQTAHTANQQGEEQAEPVQVNRQGGAQSGNPFIKFNDYQAINNLWHFRSEKTRQGQRQKTQNPA